MKMAKEDRNKLLTILVLVVMVAVLVFSIKFTKMIPIQWIGGFVLLVQFVCLVPYIVKKYLQVYGVPSTPGVYVPLINCVMIFPRVPAILLVIFMSVALAIGVLCVLPSSVWVAIFGDYVAMNLGEYLMKALNVIYYVFFLVMGIGFACVMKDIRKISKDVLGRKFSFLSLVYYPLLFLPVISILGMIPMVTELSVMNTRIMLGIMKSLVFEMN